MWYGRYEVNGKRCTLNLGVKIRGTPPESLSLREEGDGAFERSRAQAQLKLNEIVDEARRKHDSAHLVERIYELKTGEPIKSVSLDDLPGEWSKIPRRRSPSPRYAEQCHSTLARFASFVRAHNAQADELGHVTRQTARAFMAAEEARGVTDKTWNDTLKLLRATCNHLLPAGSINPFSDIPTHETETVFRKPFTPEELKAIIDAARDDDFTRPILIAGICTAMRRGDCCLLKHSDVDLAKGFITVKTSKTGATVDIPIFPLLYDELLLHQNNGSPFVFKAQAAMYQSNPDGITNRVKKILYAALCPESAQDDGLPVLEDSETRTKVSHYMAALPPSSKTDRVKTVLSLYLDGKNINEVANISGASKGSVSGYLKEAQEACGCQIVRRLSGKRDSSFLRSERKKGLRSASVYDFHSFRVTWITVALTAGVPLEIVQKVTGHKTVDIVLKHYFKPGREDFRKALHSAMPKLLTNGVQNPKEQMREIIERMTAKTWRKDAARLHDVLATF